jgi:hypothetical protein
VEFELYEDPSLGHPFAKEVGKTFVLSAVGVIGVGAGMVIIGLVGELAKRRVARRKKEAEKAPEE